MKKKLILVSGLIAVFIVVIQTNNKMSIVDLTTSANSSTVPDCPSSPNRDCTSPETGNIYVNMAKKDVDVDMDEPVITVESLSR